MPTPADSTSSTTKGAHGERSPVRATCAALYSFGRAAGQAGIGLVAALFLALYPPHAYLSMHFFSETPFALAVTAACVATLLAPLVGTEPENEREAWRRGLEFVRNNAREMAS